MKQHEIHNSIKHTSQNNYPKLMLMVLLSFVSMYILMYAMVNEGSNVILSTNQFYMAGLMAMPMIIIELLLMKSMYANKKINVLVLAISVVAMAGFYIAIRQQIAINDKQFLKSMIPHHAGAILMCNEADIKDPELKKLCEEIVASQEREIRQMKLKLSEINED